MCLTPAAAAPPRQGAAEFAASEKKPAAQRATGYSVADGRFRLGKRIAKCRSSAIHRATELATGREVAVKLEPTCTRHPQLAYELRMYGAHAGVPGIPQTLWSGAESDFNIHVMEMLGPSLEQLFQYCDRSFSTVTVVDMGVQILNRIERMHARGYVHRDVRPETFLIGRESQLNQVYLVGLAMAKRDKRANTRRRISYCGNKKALWNPMFASVNVHLGAAHSRRDDLESMGYMLAYFCRGSLPWQEACSAGRDAADKVLKAKTSIPLRDICDGCPPQVLSFLLYCRSLGFEERPDYSYLRQLLLGCTGSAPGMKQKPAYDFVRDFTVKPACPGAQGDLQVDRRVSAIEELYVHCGAW